MSDTEVRASLYAAGVTLRMADGSERTIGPDEIGLEMEGVDNRLVLVGHSDELLMLVQMTARILEDING